MDCRVWRKRWPCSGPGIKAVSRADEATQLARASGSPCSLAFALTFSGVVHRHSRTMLHALERAPMKRWSSRRNTRSAMELAWASALQALGLCHDGRVSEGIQRDCRRSWKFSGRIAPKCAVFPRHLRRDSSHREPLSGSAHIYKRRDRRRREVRRRITASPSCSGSKAGF